MAGRRAAGWRHVSDQTVRRVGPGERRSFPRRIIASAEWTPRPTKITFDAQDLTAWENILIEFLDKLETVAGERGISVFRSGLPGEAKRLVVPAQTVRWTA
jgi:hypothetical protein